VPEDELAERLDSWVRHDLPRLQSTYTDHLSERSLRLVPFLKMKRVAIDSFIESEENERISPPSQETLELCRSHELPGHFRSLRDQNSALEQLMAAFSYVEAVNSDDPKPVVSAAQSMFGSIEQPYVNRVRNLLQFARKNGYLTRGDSGRSAGVLTKQAAELVSAIEQRAAELKQATS
jgi:hypothetical protein